MPQTMSEKDQKEEDYDEKEEAKRSSLCWEALGSPLSLLAGPGEAGLCTPYLPAATLRRMERLRRLKRFKK